jgi:hypothetical protein
VKNNLYKLAVLINVLALLGMMQPGALLASDVNHGIGGTGHSGSGMGGTGKNIGGTGHSDTPSGIGGTGHSPNDGIGGTGIVGIITGFGSVWVNGVEVQYDAKTQVAENAAKASSNDLAIGDVVVIEANGSDSELQARKISVVNAVEGQVAGVDADGGKLTVLGQTVTITSKTITTDKLGQQSAIRLQPNDQIKVSGLRLANGEIVASRIERTAPTADSSVVGPITAIEGNTVWVYGLKIATNTADKLSVGQEITAAGQMKDGQLIARETTPSPTSQLYGRAEHINLQGYVGARSADGLIKVGGLEISASETSAMPKEKMDALTPGELVQINGHFANDHRVIVDRIEFSRDMPDRMQREAIGNRDHNSSDKVDHVERADHGDHSDHADRPDRPDRTDHSDAEKHSNSKHHD